LKLKVQLRFNWNIIMRRIFFQIFKYKCHERVSPSPIGEGAGGEDKK